MHKTKVFAKFAFNNNTVRDLMIYYQLFIYKQMKIINLQNIYLLFNIFLILLNFSNIVKSKFCI